MNIHYGVEGGYVFALMRSSNRRFREKVAGLAVPVAVQHPFFQGLPVYRVTEEQWGAFQEAALEVYPGSTFSVRYGLPPWLREAVVSLEAEREGRKGRMSEGERPVVADVEGNGGE